MHITVQIDIKHMFVMLILMKIQNNYKCQVIITITITITEDV